MTPYTPSPFTPDAFPEMHEVQGVEIASAASGSRYKNRDDLFIARFPAGTTAAGVFTQSATASACVHACKDALSNGAPRLLVVNAGNANACTGEDGARACNDVRAGAAEAFSVPAEGVFHCATGVIGVRLDTAPLTSAMQEMAGRLSGDAQGWEFCARAIMTTDTYPKALSIKKTVGGKEVTFTAFAKGSGMIAPDMATMLAFVFTDAAIDTQTLQTLFAASCNASYNAITVDGDTSTNDTALIFATGKAGNARITDPHGKDAAAFAFALNLLSRKLAMLIVGDGEGITKRLDITVTGAENNQDARTLAMTVGNSPLVKTAIFGADPNWGRIMMAIGKAGVPFALDRTRVAVCGMILAAEGEAVRGPDLQKLSEHIKQAHIVPIDITVGAGPGAFTAYSADLSYEYIRINAEYTT